MHGRHGMHGIHGIHEHRKGHCISSHVMVAQLRAVFVNAEDAVAFWAFGVSETGERGKTDWREKIISQGSFMEFGLFGVKSQVFWGSKIRNLQPTRPIQ